MNSPKVQSLMPGRVDPLKQRSFRHPMYWLLVVLFFATPVMTVPRALLALSLTIYALFGNSINEHDIEHERDELEHRRARLERLRPKLK